MAFIFPSFLDTIIVSFQAREKIHCFHCDEKMRKDNALIAVFNGASHPVCCHGCVAVLQAIENNGMALQYLHAKSVAKMTESPQ
jgi:Putative metal-binding domain of cation transport ATPase